MLLSLLFLFICTGAEEIKIGTYNTFLRPTELFRDSQLIRAEYIPQEINTTYPELDVQVFQELFDEKSSSILHEEMIKNFPYFTGIISKNPNTNIKIINGGVRIYSKYEIIDKDNLIFKQGANMDDYSGKGVMYVKINKNGFVFNVFGTHLQSGNSPNINKVRKSQFEEIKSFIKDKNIPSKESVFICGDFNTQNINNIRDGLNSYMPQSLREIKNTLSREFSKRYKRGKFVSKKLDHIVIAWQHKRPQTEIIKSVDLIKSSGYKILKNKRKIRYGRQVLMKSLSDHSYLYGIFYFS